MSGSSVSARERILGAADELFNRQGVQATGVDSIIEAAGVAKATFYKQFPSKDDLVSAWLGRRSDEWQEWFDKAVARRAREPRRRLLAAFDALGEWFAQDDFEGCPFINTSVELRDHQRPARAVAVGHMAGLRSWFEATAAQAEIANPREIANSLFLLVEGAALSETTGTVAHPARVAKRAAAALVGE
jgi:AcrR family transcriptional regulator